ncbi:MAG: response regulator, partial [Spirochaetaceae bacterium]|nr:response regulator [Spirochaetaceae bacterium]
MDSINVLIVDDSALMRNLIGRIIEAAPGLSLADRAMNGRFALEKIPRCDPDVIVLDIEMPEMDGLQFLRERRKRRIDIPVIMLSGRAEQGATITMQCLELGASDFITKPGAGDGGGLSSVSSRLVELLLSYGGQY